MNKSIRLLLNAAAISLLLGFGTSFAQPVMINKFNTSFHFLPLVNPISSLVYKLISLPKNLISP